MRQTDTEDFQTLHISFLQRGVDCRVWIIHLVSVHIIGEGCVLVEHLALQFCSQEIRVEFQLSDARSFPQLIITFRQTLSKHTQL